MPSSPAIHGEYENQGTLRFWDKGERINVEISAPHGTRSIPVTPTDLAVALNSIPGFTVKYVKPIAVPQYLGAVVQRDEDRWVRVQHRSDSSYGWARAGVPSVTLNDDDIAGILANGGYEREPEFPVRTP